MCLVIRRDTKPTKIRKDRKVFKLLDSSWRSANREFPYEAGKNYLAQIKPTNDHCSAGETDNRWIGKNFTGSSDPELKWFGAGFHFYTTMAAANEAYDIYNKFGSYMIVEFVIPALRSPEIYINKETGLGITNQISCTHNIVKKPLLKREEF